MSIPNNQQQPTIQDVYFNLGRGMNTLFDAIINNGQQLETANQHRQKLHNTLAEIDKIIQKEVPAEDKLKEIKEITKSFATVEPGGR